TALIRDHFSLHRASAAVPFVTELSPTGTTLGTFVVGSNPQGVAIDASGIVWVTNSSGNSVTELSHVGTTVGTFAPSGANFNNPQGVAIDAAGNVWVPNSSGDSVAEIVGAARPVLTPLIFCLIRLSPAAFCLP